MVTLALIGLGDWGKKYIQAASHIPSCRIGYVCSVHVDRHHDISDMYKRVSDYRELAHHDIDGVIIATPSKTHYDIAKFFLQRDQNILIEKPLTLNYQDALSLHRIHQAHKSVVAVNHIYLYHPAVVKMVSLITSLGTIRYLDSQGGSFGPFRTDTSPLWDWAPHDIALLLRVTQDKPLSVRAWSVRTNQEGKSVDSLIYIELTFRKLRALLKVGSLFPTKKREFTVFGTKGALIFNDLTQRKLVFYTGERYATKTYPSYEDRQPLVGVLSDFVSCIENKKQPVSDLSSAVAVIHIIDAIEHSLRRKGEFIRIV